MSLPRGVWDAPWTSLDGFRELVAIDSFGHKVDSLILTDLCSEEEAADLLWAALDKADPLAAVA